MTAFDHDRLRSMAFSEVYPYGFHVWDVPNGRRGGMVCFRGECQTGIEGSQDVRLVGWWMAEFFRVAGNIDALVVDTYELGGGWHDDLTFLPAGIPLPLTFQVLYSVMRDRRERGVALWGEDRVRDSLDAALAEMDGFLGTLPAVADRQVS